MVQKNSFDTYRTFVGPVLVICIWSLVSYGGIASSTLLPQVHVTLVKLFEIFLSGEIFPHLLSTLWITFAGFVLASIFGVSIGVYLGAYPKVYKMFETVIEFFRSLPGTAMFPLFLLVFGIGDGSKIAIAFFISFWVILVNAAYGVIQSSKIRRRVANSFGASDTKILTSVTFMDALPQIYIGLKVGLSLALIAVVVSEMFIGSNTGLGQKIYDSYLTYEISNLYAWLFITGTLGYILSRLCSVFETRYIHWTGR